MGTLLAKVAELMRKGIRFLRRNMDVLALFLVLAILIASFEARPLLLPHILEGKPVQVCWPYVVLFLDRPVLEISDDKGQIIKVDASTLRVEHLFTGRGLFLLKKAVIQEVKAMAPLLPSPPANPLDCPYIFSTIRRQGLASLL